MCFFFLKNSNIFSFYNDTFLFFSIFQGHYDDEHKGHKGKHGHEKHHHHEDKYDKKGGKKGGHKKGYESKKGGHE